PGRRLDRVTLLGDPAQHAVHETRRAGMAVLGCELHRFVDGGVRGNAIEEQQLICAEPQYVADPGWQLAEPNVHARIEHPVESAAPAQRALHELVQQAAVGPALGTRLDVRVRRIEHAVAERRARREREQDAQRRLAGIGRQPWLALLRHRAVDRPRSRPTIVGTRPAATGRRTALAARRRVVERTRAVDGIGLPARRARGTTAPALLRAATAGIRRVHAATSAGSNVAPASTRAPRAHSAAAISALPS